MLKCGISKPWRRKGSKKAVDEVLFRIENSQRGIKLWRRVQRLSMRCYPLKIEDSYKWYKTLAKGVKVVEEIWIPLICEVVV